MRQSQLFSKTRKEAPSDEVSKNAQLLIRAGFIHKEMAGVYSYLPLGLRVLKKIENIIREEMNAIGGQEIELTALQNKELWEKTNRWDDSEVDVWFKIANDKSIGLGFTHEEPLTRLMTEHIRSFRDLPVYAYQFQTKFRNETRAKSGVMRGREFLMKDLYSFNADQAGLDEFYEKVSDAYKRIFERFGFGNNTYKTFASGGAFAKYSHEFQTVCDAGEDIIYVDEAKKIAVNKEVYTDEVISDLGILKKDLVEKKSVEVGNIFKLGTRFSEPLGLTYLNEEGKQVPVVMGSYGIGPARSMGTVVELLSDDKGIIWPREIAPFSVHLLCLSESVRAHADALYDELISRGVEVLYDDRDLRPGEKFADSDLIGIPVRFVVSEKTIAENKVEVKQRASPDSELVLTEEAFKLL